VVPCSVINCDVWPARCCEAQYNGFLIPCALNSAAADSDVEEEGSGDEEEGSGDEEEGSGDEEDVTPVTDYRPDCSLEANQQGTKIASDVDQCCNYGSNSVPVWRWCPAVCTQEALQNGTDCCESDMAASGWEKCPEPTPVSCASSVIG